MSTQTLARVTVLSLIANVSRLQRLVSSTHRLYLASKIPHARFTALLAFLEPRLQDALNTLAAAIEAAPWGSQDNGRVFVTRTSGRPQDYSAADRVYIDRIQVCSLEQRDSPEWAAYVADPQDAKAARATQRAENQAHERWYSAALAEAADLLRNGDPAILSWQTDSGQQGGRVYIGSGWISLPGLMRAAGYIDNGSWTHHEDFYNIKKEVAEVARAKHLRITRPRLSTRDRSLPASDRRRALAQASL